MINIAVIFTCFNRKKKTERCMVALCTQKEKHLLDYNIEVFVTDDGSTDGTTEMLETFSKKLNIRIFKSNNQYWDKGMYIAMQEAIKKSYDYYLMINDDVDFYETFLEIMLDSYKEAGGNCGISGATHNSMKNCTTYGGKDFRQKGFLNPDGNIKECNLANWNCFLVNEEVIDKVGIIDPNYVHSYGDYDYSMAMQRKGFKIYLAKQYIGTCNRNTIKGSFKDKSLSRKQRIKKFFSPKGMSLKSGMRYSIKNIDYLGVKSLLKFLVAYFRNLIVVLVG